MKTINDKLQKHTFIAALMVAALAGCDGQDAKAPEEALLTPKVAESKPAPTPVAPATPSPAPVAQAQPEPAQPPAKPVIELSNDKSGLVNIAKGKIAAQSGDLLPSTKASLAVDGNVNGDATHGGSITHTKQNANAWLDIDLGDIDNIDHVVVWNRTDGGQKRLVNYWIFISKKPFSPKDTVANIKKDKSVTAIKGGDANPSYTTPSVGSLGRYVRIQLDGSSSPNNAFLHVAEVEVYRASK